MRNLREIAEHPWFAGATAALGGLAGMLGSVFSQEIKFAFPFYLPTTAEEILGSQFIWQACVFWVALYIFGWCFKTSIAAQSDSSKKALNELKTNAEKLELLIKTLPDEGFLWDFVSFYELVNKQVNLALKTEADSDTIEIAVAMCLNALGQLARLFDGKASKVYRIHLMLFKEVPTDSNQAAELLGRVKFAESNSDYKKWRGVLDSYPDLALTIENDGSSTQDRLAKAFTLPIPLPEYRTDGGRSTVLPGPAEAFCYPAEEAGYILPDTSRIGEWFKNESGFRPELADQVKNYFLMDPGKRIRSILSLPFGENSNGTVEADGEPLGVLNIHSDSIDIIDGRGAKLFVPLTAPFRIMLAMVVKKSRLIQAS